MVRKLTWHSDLQKASIKTSMKKQTTRDHCAKTSTNGTKTHQAQRPPEGPKPKQMANTIRHQNHLTTQETKRQKQTTRPPTNVTFFVVVRVQTFLIPVFCVLFEAFTTNSVFTACIHPFWVGQGKMRYVQVSPYPNIHGKTYLFVSLIYLSFHIFGKICSFASANRV